MSVRYEERGAIALLTLDRPEQLNAFDEALRLGFIEAARRANASAPVRAIVVAGAGRGFSAGAHLAGAVPDRAEALRQLNEQYLPGILEIAQGPKPAIAAVQGFATGIGAGYVLACDLVVMGASAFMQIPFARIGLIPDGGLCWQLVTRLGHRRAFELAIEAERIPAARCVELGLANRVVPDERVLEEACAWAERLAAGPPLALALTKQVFRRAASMNLEDAMRAEAEAQVRCIESADFREGVAAFLEKRAPRFEGR